MPHLVEMQNKYKSKGVILIALSDEPESKVKPFLKKYKSTYIVGSGAKSTLSEYGIRGWPTLFLIDPEGKVAWKGHSPAAAESALEDLLKQSPPKKKGFLASKSAKAAYRSAMKLYEARKYSKAKQAFDDLAKGYKGSKYGKKASSKLKAMRANSRVRGIIAKEKAERISKGWLEVARTLAQYGDKKDALKYYRRILKKYPGTKYAKLARSEKELLEAKD